MDTKKFITNNISLDKLNETAKFDNLDEMISILGEDIVYKYITLKGKDYTDIINSKLNYDDVLQSILEKKLEKLRNNIPDVVKNSDEINSINEISNIINLQAENSLIKNEDFLKIVKKAFKNINKESINDTTTLNILDVKNLFGSSAIEEYWLKNRNKMFNNVNINESGLINEISNDLVNKKSKMFDSIVEIGSFFSIEKNKIIIDINKATNIFEGVKNIFNSISLEEVAIMGKIVPTLGTLMLYRRITSLYSNFLLKQEDNFMKNIYNNNEIQLNELKQIQKINRLSMLTFNIFTLVVIGGILTAYTATINKNLSWKFTLSEKTSVINDESNQSFIPLFILNKIKSIKNHFALIFLLIFIGGNLFSHNFFKITQVSYFYLIVFVLVMIIGLILQLLFYLYFMNYNGEINKHVVIKYLPNVIKNKIIGCFAKNIEPKVKEFIISHYYKLIFIYTLMIIVLLILLLVFMILFI